MTNPMDDDNYKYDVAFSFLEKDETLAAKLNDLLQDRLSTFLYSKKQEDIAGTDGEITFNTVFGKQARLVVVLYRAGWGETPWTRIEDTAIRNRAHEQGYDFAIFIPLDDPPSVPDWIPKNRLWVGLNRWGINGAASVIEARVQEQGGFPYEESVKERAKRLERAINFENERKQFLISNGVHLSDEEFTAMGDELERLVDIIKKNTNIINYSVKRTNRQIVILGSNACLNIRWKGRYANSIESAELYVELWEGHPPFPGITSVFFESKQITYLTFQFALLRPETPGWKFTNPSGQEFDSKALAEFILKFYMDDAEPKGL
jgi:hypothetical protein